MPAQFKKENLPACIGVNYLNISNYIESGTVLQSKMGAGMGARRDGSEVRTINNKVKNRTHLDAPLYGQFERGIWGGFTATPALQFYSRNGDIH